MIAHTACLVREHRQRVDVVAETVTFSTHGLTCKAWKETALTMSNEEDASYSLYKCRMIAAGKVLHIDYMRQAA